jgi:hypothetical protein
VVNAIRRVGRLLALAARAAFPPSPCGWETGGSGGGAVG